MSALVKIRGLEHTYRLEGGGRIPALRGIDLTIDHGSFVALIGPNGSGKSTLARHLNGLLVPQVGDVIVDGLSTTAPRNLWRVRQRVGMVFQNPDNQIVAGTVEEDVAFGPENAALPPAEIRRRVDDALDTVGLQAYRTHPPTRLSGGQKQLLAIAGILATRPTCIVFDEPTSMLDPPGRRQVLETIHEANVEERITVVLITHSMDEAATASRVLVMHEGRIVMDGPPETVFDKAGRLQAIGLDVPVTVQMAQGLRAEGIALSPNQLTVDELARALC
jgi:energy-coupling factor transport system ATP-binding protein